MKSGELQGFNVASAHHRRPSSFYRIREAIWRRFWRAEAACPMKPARRKRRNTGDVIKFF